MGGGMAPLTITWTLRHHGWAFTKVADKQGESDAIVSYVRTAMQTRVKGTLIPDISS